MKQYRYFSSLVAKCHHKPAGTKYRPPAIAAYRHLSSPTYVPPTVSSELPPNEPIYDYLPGSKERDELKAKLSEYWGRVTEIPIVIGEKEHRTSNTGVQVAPFDHRHQVASYSYSTPELAKKAVQVSLERSREWEATDINYRIGTLLKAADLASGKYRQDLNAATMLGQGKTVIQAEIDSAAELADFFRFNAYYAQEVYRFQPISPADGSVKNTFRIRGLEGFVAAISPFNFTAIAGNLCTAPALFGNAVVWKPSSTSLLSNWIIFNILKEAGFAPGVISFLPSKPLDFSEQVISSPDLAAVNFTGSVQTFRTIWKNVANNLENTRTYPRMVGECGGKDFHFIHPSADLKTATAQTIKAAFEYSGQKCSACSRLYVPKSLWPQMCSEMIEIMQQLKLGSPMEFDTFLSAVIDSASFNRNKSFIEHARSDSSHEILFGGNTDDTKGYFVDPTLIVTTDPYSKLMVNEIFGPVLTVYVYDDSRIEETLELVDKSTKFGLTGSIFATDRSFLKHATDKLKYAAGNFYINDKSTGAIVGQQPFGGARLSGTNDKAGAPQYLYRWISPQNIKETFVPLPEVLYPYMSSK